MSDDIASLKSENALLTLEVESLSQKISEQQELVRKLTREKDKLDHEVEEAKANATSKEALDLAIKRDISRLRWGKFLILCGLSAGGTGIYKLLAPSTWGSDKSNNVIDLILRDSHTDGGFPYRGLSALAIFGFAFGILHIAQRLFISESTYADIERLRIQSKTPPEGPLPVETVRPIADAISRLADSITSKLKGS